MVRRGYASTLLAIVGALTGTAPATADTQSLDRACEAAFGAGFVGRIEIATGGPICAKIEGFAIEYQRPDPSALCSEGAPEVLNEGREFRCAMGKPAKTETLQAGAGTEKPLKPLAPNTDRSQKPEARTADKKKGTSNSKAEVLRPLPKTDGREGSGNPRREVPEEVTRDDPSEGTEEGVVGDASESGFARISQPPLIDFDALLPVPGGAVLPGEGLSIAPEIEAQIVRAMGADWREGISENVMPRVEMEIVQLESGAHDVRWRVTSCHRSEAPVQENWLPGTGSGTGSGTGEGAATPGLPMSLPSEIEGMPVALPSTDTHTGTSQKLLFITEALRLRRAAGETGDPWPDAWNAFRDPLGMADLSPPALCSHLSGIGGDEQGGATAPNLLTGMIAEMVRGFTASIDPAVVPTLGSYVISANEIAALQTLCEDIARYRAANLRWVTHCAPLNPGLQAAVLSTLPGTPPTLQSLVENGMLTPLIPAGDTPLAEDNGAATDARL